MYFQQILQSNGISSEIYSLINNEEVRPTANLIISNCTAYEYLNNSNPNIEKLTTQYYETFSITGKFTGYFSNITLGDFYNNLSSTYSSPTAILGGLNSTARKENLNNPIDSSSNTADPNDLIAGTSTIEGNRGTENFGLAVFKEDKLCGELTAIETMCHLLIQNKIDSCIVSIDNPIQENKIEVQLFPKQKSNIQISIENNIPYIAISLNLHADIITLNENIDYESNETLEKISNATEAYLTTSFKNYLEKVSTEYNTDIDHFCNKASSHFLTISDWKNYNWNDVYSKSKYDISINVNVLSSMLVTRT